MSVQPFAAFGAEDSALEELQHFLILRDASGAAAVNLHAGHCDSLCIVNENSISS